MDRKKEKLIEGKWVAGNKERSWYWREEKSGGTELFVFEDSLGWQILGNGKEKVPL